MGDLEKNLKKGLKDLMSKDNKGIKNKLKRKPINVTNKKGMEKAIREISGMEMGGKVKKMQFGGDPTGNAMSEADMKRMQELMARKQTQEGGNTISEADLKRLKEALKGAATAGMMGSGIGKGMPQGKKMGGKVQKMNMGGQVMDTTKSMPVGMMDGGKVKKMNMGGVIPGRGGMFKGMK